MWPFSRREVRDGSGSSSFTDAIVASILSNAGRSVADVKATAALEACSGLIQRSFQVATVEGDRADTLTPTLLGQIGRALIRQGEWVGLIEVNGIAVVYPCQSWTVRGRYPKSTWRYDVTMPGPSRTTSRKSVPQESIVHIRYATDPHDHWRGIGPLQSASLAGKLSAELTTALADEAGGPRGSVLPLPQVDGQDSTVAQLRADIRNLAGKLAFVESTSGKWTTDGPTASAREWEPRRLGFDAPASEVSAMTEATKEVMNACGVNPSLFSAGDGTAQREAWRQFLFGTVMPLARLVEAELSEKLDSEIVLNFDNLQASDIQGRARAYQSLVGGGMNADHAAEIAGVSE